MGTEPWEPSSANRMSHRGRVVRVVVALALTAGGLVPVPYIGWGYGAALCGPAAVLLFYAGLDRATRRVVFFWAIPTIVGLALGLLSLAAYALRDGAGVIQVLGVACLTTLAAAVLGRPQTA